MHDELACSDAPAAHATAVQIMGDAALGVIARDSVPASVCGMPRFAYDWASERWRKQHHARWQAPWRVAAEQTGRRRAFNRWALAAPKPVPQLTAKNLGAAFQRFFRGEGKRLQCRTKGWRDSAWLDDDPAHARRKARGSRVPRQADRMRERVRLPGRLSSAVVRHQAGRCHASLARAMQRRHPVRERQADEAARAHYPSLTGGTSAGCMRYLRPAPWRGMRACRSIPVGRSPSG